MSNVEASYSADGISFFSNYDSRKGRELEENPHASMLFYWPSQYKQIRVEGIVSKLPVEQAETYWSSMPLSLRIGYRVSEHCSAAVPNKQVYYRFLHDRYIGTNKIELKCDAKCST
ncbi:unnamed protein product [Strongylus vulgaris]|uniref:pyridoxal 5'-phosphate synthase n=1 Tax=Strongylus vulgaris TaxID=40348 RepID=A0A3P7JM12_STRVU|nr:unnamed protein product [Strongylus vulgaris]